MSDQLPPRAVLAESLIELFQKHGTQEFAEAKKWFSKISLEGAEEKLIVNIAESLANSICDGLIQLSVEEMTKTKQYQDALQRGYREFELSLHKDLPTLRTYVEFVFSYGSRELATTRSEFDLASRVDAKDIKVVVENMRIVSASFDTVTATVSLSILVEGVEVQIGSIEKELRLEYKFPFPTETEGETTTVAQPERIDQTTTIMDGTKKCVRCGARIQSNAKFCGMCGAKQT